MSDDTKRNAAPSEVSGPAKNTGEYRRISSGAMKKPRRSGQTAAVNNEALFEEFLRWREREMAPRALTERELNEGGLGAVVAISSGKGTKKRWVVCKVAQLFIGHTSHERLYEVLPLAEEKRGRKLSRYKKVGELYDPASVPVSDDDDDSEDEND